MKIYNPSNATLFCSDENNHVNFAVDPWLTSAFEEGWYPLVKSNNKEALSNLFKNFNFVLITHIHEDHFDYETLKLFFKKGTKVIMPEVFGAKVFQKIVKNIGLEPIILKEYESIDLKGTTITAIPSINTDSVNDTDELKTELSIDGGFSVSCNNTKLLVLADNNPYNRKKIKEKIKFYQDIDLLLVSHNGFASEYPYNYGYDKNTCLKKYKKLEETRQNKQLRNIKDLIKPKYLVPYSSSFIPNYWVNQNWWYCAENSKFFNNKDAAKEFKKLTGITTVASNINEFININNDKIEILNLEKNKFFYSIRNSLEENSIGDLPIKKDSNKDTKEKLQELKSKLEIATKNYYDKLSIFKLKPNFNINIHYDVDNFCELKNETAEEDSLLEVFIDKFFLLKVLNKQVHWDSAFLSYKLNFKRSPDYYCNDTYLALHNLKL